MPKQSYLTTIFIFNIMLVLNVKSQVFFDDAASQGLSIVNRSTDYWGSGLSTFDFNQDGWDDISLVIEDDTQAIYMNNHGNFELAPFSIYSNGQNKQILWVDYDNDYDLDIFITKKFGKNVLLKNIGNFQFLDVTLSAGLSSDIARNYGASFVDYDLDGDLDLYVCKYLDIGDSTNLVHLNNLYKNNGDGTFIDVTLLSGFDQVIEMSFQSLWFDYNSDLFPDLFVINDRATFENEFYHNNGDGTFTNVTTITNTEMLGASPMSVTMGDYDNDNDQDIFVTEIGGPGGPAGQLLTQIGQSFNNLSNVVGIGVPADMWGADWLDYNNDGILDLFITTDHPNLAPNYFYRGDTTFNFHLDTSLFIADYASRSFGVANGDFNSDGYSDIVVGNLDSPFNFLWMNSGGVNNYIKVTLEGTVSNSFAIGSEIKVFSSEQTQTKYTVCGENYLGQNSQNYIFGIGQDTIVDSVHVIYPSGIKNRYYNLYHNQSYHFIENQPIQNLNFSILGNNPFCEGDSVILFAPDMLSYSWSTGDTSQYVKIHSEGQYYVDGIDSNGVFIQSDTLNIDMIQLPNISSQIEDVSCYNGSNGAIVLSVINEGQAHQIEWSTGETGGSLSGLTGGNYSYTYLDSYGCSSQDSIHVGNPFPINFQVDIQPQTNIGQGSIQVLVNGGEPPYIVSVDSIEIGSQLIYLDEGLYALNILDNNGCAVNHTVNIEFQDTSLVSRLVGGDWGEIKVSPNPFKKEIHVSIPFLNIEGVEFKLLDIIGRLVTKIEVTENSNSTKKKYTIQILDDIPPGIYYLSINSLSHEKFFSLIKQ